MRTIKVKKDKLLEKLKQNRDAHRALFLKAQEGYRKVVIQVLDRSLAEARKEGGKIRIWFNIDAPIDHTRDYNRVIGMLQWHGEEDIELTEVEYTNYILDDWSWKSAFVSTSCSYSTSSSCSSTVNKVFEEDTPIDEED